jgi:hypothetical protein
METKNPFYFGHLVAGAAFTDREKDTQRLVANFKNGLNTILISPRRWGKSSLVQKAGEVTHGRKVKVAYLDLFSVRSEQEFYTAYARAVVAATSTKWEDWLKTLKEFFKQITPKVTIGADPTSDFSIGFSWSEVQKNVDEVLNLPNKIATAKGYHMVVCIDEFQNIANFTDSVAFQKLLRSKWQKHSAACYCLYGSKFHMMQELFERQSMPFYRFGDLMHLEKISEKDWLIFIKEQFAKTRKKISSSLTEKIIRAVDRHSYYVQQLAYLIWEKTKITAITDIFDEALEDMIRQNALLYQRDTEEMAATQLNFLRAVASGVTQNHSSTEVLNRYSLGTSANVSKIKKHLRAKEFIDIRNGEVFFIDPVYELWFQKEILGVRSHYLD